MDFFDEPDKNDFFVALDEGTLKKAQLPEKHLDSPIMISLLERLQNNMQAVLDQHRDLKPSGPDPRRLKCITNYLRDHPEEAYSSIKRIQYQYSEVLDYCAQPPEILNAKIYPYLFSQKAGPSYRLHSDFKQARRIFKHELDAYASHLSDLLSPAQLSAFKAKYDFSPVLHSRVVDSASRAQLWSDIVEKYRREYRTARIRYKHTLGPLRFVCGDGFLIIKSDDLSRWQLMTYEQLQMIQDCCLARHNIELSLAFNFHNGTSDLREHVDRILRWQEKILLTYGNNGYELVKAPEAVFKAWLNSLTNGDLLTYSSYDRTMDKMRTKEAKLDPQCPLVRALDRIVKQVSSIHDAAELFGLSKLSGHPVVYAKKSLLSVRSEAEPVGTISPLAVRRLERMFKHMTLAGFINENQSWPPFKCPPALNTMLRRHWTNRVTTLPMGSYPLSDLDAIVFDKFVEYDYSEDYLKFLDDKAICPGATEMAKFWFPGPRAEPRRLLEKILKTKHFDTVSMVERLRRGKFTPDEYVVELTQKERELKTAARCFCKLPFEVRTFFTSTEYNLKEQFMKKYIPQQTMTMSNNETKMRMYNLVKHAKSRNRTLLEVDFSRWNLRWRQCTVQGVASVLEDIFGMEGVFSQAHPFFQKATVVMTDKHSIPAGADPNIPVTQWPESDLLYRGTHRGGFEGIQQALWTLCTVAMMYWVLHDQSVSFMMAGQGDNQIFALTFTSTTQSPADQLRCLLAIMETRCAYLNHEVKPDECIDSSTVLTYSKDIYVEGNHVLYNLKFSSRTFKRDEIDMPSLSTEIASISACSMACADSVYDTPKAIFWKTFQTLRLLSQRLRSENYKIEHAALAELLSEPDLLEFALLLPGSLGGFPVMSWSRFFMKGEVDDLSWDVPAVRALGRTVPSLLTDLVNVMKGNYTPRNRNLRQLILDPTSIPIERPRDLKRLVKDAVAEKLPGLTYNTWISNIFNSQAEAAGEQLLDTLSQTRPFYPKIMSDIYSLSPSGVRDALLSRFTMTRTINTITGNPNFSVEISVANACLIRFVKKRWELAKDQKSTNVLPSTSYATCSALRELWGSDVKQSCIGVYNPFDFKLKYTSDSIPMISASSRCQGLSLTQEIGSYPPNFGTKTRQKVSDHGFKIITSSSTVSDLKTLVMTASELGLDINMMKLLSEISRARSPWSIPTLLPILPTAYGGTAAHRHQDINRAAFSLLGSRTVPTHLNFCSDRAGVLSGGEFDYPFAFQEFYLVLTNMFQVLTGHGLLDTNASIGFVLTDDYEQIPDDPVSLPPPNQHIWKMQPTNKLVYVSRLMVREVPLVPASYIVPHLAADQITGVDLAYNYFLLFLLRKQRALASTKMVNYPLDVLDLKEYSHGKLVDFERALSMAIQSVAISTALQQHTRDAHVFLHSYLFKLCQAVSGPFVRLFTHSQSQCAEYVVQKHVVTRPGASGAVAAADSFAGYLYERSLISMRARELPTLNPKLVLFADYEQFGPRQAEALWTSMLAMCAPNNATLLLTSFQRLMISSATKGVIANARALHRIYHLKSTISSLISSRIIPGQRQQSISATFTPEMVYCNSVSSEAIRALRSLPKEVRLLRQASPGLPLNFAKRPGQITFTLREMDGHLRPDHTCPAPTNIQRVVDGFLSKLTRPYGMYSTALDVWLTVLSQYRNTIGGAQVTSIGVGHGAAATAALLLSAKQVFGIDLRSAFPTVTQREGTYVPPEIVANGYSPLFEWDRHVYEKGGDIMQLSAETSARLNGREITVLDIELDLQSILPIIPLVLGSKLTLIRVFCCREWLRYCIDAFGVSDVYQIGVPTNTHKQVFILACKNERPCTTLPNILRAELGEQRPYKTVTTKSMARMLSLVNRVVSVTGETLKIMSAPECVSVSDRLHTRANNSVSTVQETFLRDHADQLAIMAACFRQAQQISSVDLMTLNREYRSLLGQWLANSGVNTTALVAQLVSET